ncbi:MAG: bifunctional 2-C-methyl-D-erythritol 4-phosphate cytidylyltransferase/2-C-methyl-D-erythritol 2,4-cyclodiphosphate synthase [Sulfurospirillaceae bacterium]|nr:bifunctional 2-C-methyl-D-erythritol 4-phosphate cytidylyltransferase/2-C-methyl-D-erythritol 2,4-cyclodiphosphate synthase [Sulfurospirillaceae bacterium]MDD3462624.1 bifunctional 2-C-methyl-D-erythritol 4-phosphate cytidylyltransferase/2-C-methyl-D-erythritol 2,4-cyclodiphosphate synthase [Sulfurospirillaceae bacterium]
MPELTLVMLGAGSSSRFDKKIKKQWLRVEDAPLWLFVSENLSQKYPFKKVIVTFAKEDLPYAQKFSNTLHCIEGGSTRQESLQKALLHVKTPYVLVSDVARACISDKTVKELIDQCEKYDIVVPYVDICDTVIYNNQTINREDVKLIQTPQLSKTEVLTKALDTKKQFTDESSAIGAFGGKVGYVKGDKSATKITFEEDLSNIPCLKSPSSNSFIGNGFDVHAFEEGKIMKLGGVVIREDIGFKAHSDGDVLIHALIDALLGASGAGDIGELFPDSDEAYKGIDSEILLEKVSAFLTKTGFEIVNCDVTIMAEFPKISTFKDAIRFHLAKIMDIAPIHVNIKATTTEKLGFIGRKEGLAVHANVVLKYYDWKNI